MRSKMAQATLGSFVAMYSLNFIWYGFLAKGFNDQQFMMVLRGPQDFSPLSIAVGYFLLAVLLAYIYPFGYRGGRSGSQGLRFGIMMGLLIALPAALISSGAYKLPLAANLVDATYRIVEMGVGGLIIGRLYGTAAAK